MPKKIPLLGHRLALRLFLVFLILQVVAACPAPAQTEVVLYSFGYSPDGREPFSALTRDAEGNLYGTTVFGGAADLGTIFKLTPDGTETVLHSFRRPTDGSFPEGGLILDAAGNLYGTTLAGGIGCGTVFKVSPDIGETVLYSFTGVPGGCEAQGNLIRDAAGNFYGTTVIGGVNGGGGTVFKLTPSGTETVLYSFSGTTDGEWPEAGVIRDAAGNLYGTTYQGGTNGIGTVFKVTPSGTETVLYSFVGGTDGNRPTGGLIRDEAGNLYGTTSLGGVYGFGTVFKLTPGGQETILHSFTGSDGGWPAAALIQDAAGNLYGTTQYGGNTICSCGTIFKLAADGTETVLYQFNGNPRRPDGGVPFAPLLQDEAGNFYSTTYRGGTFGNGTVFELIP